MNVNITSSTNSTDNIFGLDPGAGDFLRDCGRGGLQALEIVAMSENVFSPSLKAAVADTLAIIDITKKFNTNKKAWAEFSENLIAQVEKIIQYTCHYGKDHVPLAWQSSLEHLKGVLNYLKERGADVQQCSQWRRLPSFTEDMAYIEEFKSKLNEAMGAFKVQASQILEQNLYKTRIDTSTDTEATVAKQSMNQVSVLAGAQDIQMDNAVIIAANTVNYNNNGELPCKVNERMEELKKNEWLKELKAPSHKQRERCMPGTCVDVLRDIQGWLCDLNMPNILWLSGSPGSGKTTIASTVVADFESFSGQFFFHHDQAEFCDPDNLWRLLALDLAVGNNALGKSIAMALETQKANIRGLDISMQFEHLIVKPVQELFQDTATPLLIVIDALDECDQYEKLLPSLKSWSWLLPKYLKLFITSRRYLDIQRTLDSVSQHIDLHTGGKVSDQTSKDLELYFTTRFSNMTRLQTSLHVNWPGPDNISFLVRKAAGLYIWAKSAMDFILHRGGDTKERLDVICSDSGEGIHAIDTLYQHIVFVAFQGLREAEKKSLSSVLGTIVIAKNPLRASDLEQLLGVQGALSIVSQLSPVLLISDTGHLHIRHQSFTDFLLDRKRSKAFWVDSQKHSLCFAGSCMKYMSAKLKFNFFDLKTSHILNKDIPNLMDHIKNVKSTALAHASHFWAIYLQRYSDKTLEEEILVQMEIFLMNHLLHWLEIMSLMGAVNHAAHLLLLTENWCSVLKPSMSEFASDANQFIMTFFEPISDAAPHIYISALPFAPQDSKISMHFMRYFAKTLTIENGQIKQWPDRCLLRIKTRNGPLAYSPDGRHIVSGFVGAVQVWDALTGNNIISLKGHAHYISSVAYSPNGKHIISGSWDKTIKIWDALTGQCVMGPLEGHCDTISSVAVSPDGGHIVSGSRDTTIRVWNTLTGQSVMNPLTGHHLGVTSVAYSPSGRHIVSGSLDGTIRIWNAGTGQCVMDPLIGHNSIVNCVAYSPNGMNIVSGSVDKTIRVWDALSGQSVMVLYRGSDPIGRVTFSPDGKHIVCATQYRIIRFWNALTSECMLSPLEDDEHSVSFVAFSPNGKHIISGCGNNTIKVWDALTGHTEIDHVRGHNNGIRSVAFSPNGKHIVSGSNDATLRVWDALTGLSVMGPLRGHYRQVTSVAFSPDGRYIASGSHDCTIRVWDALTGQSAMDPLKGHDNGVISVVFSPDGRYIASGSWDKTVRVWNALTGQSVLNPFIGHTHRINSVSFSPDGKFIISGSEDRRIRAWDALTGQSIMKPLIGHKGGVESVAFSPDGRYIVSGSNDEAIRVWDFNAGQSVMDPLKGHGDDVTSVAFSPDGKYIVSGSCDKTIRLWDAVTGHTLGDPFKGHYEAVLSVVFSPDGRHIASGSSDNTIRLWDAHGGCIDLNPSAPSVPLPSRFLPSEVRNNVNDSGTHHNVSHIVKSKPVVFYPSQRHKSDNWIIGEDFRSHLFWVPPHNKHGLFFPRTVNVLGTTPTILDFSNFVHGTNWSQCFSPAL
ncbi:uncharacterized protein LACBIDRAFT_314645 [Laccaria bicolor S238N-H82]|uniref:Predicted protein n=1 Tax=Laccaria bicolor (strain S238N-H82 / ATCC MYA-4686) TaxID=486041 RepID=B0DYY4_LACBS|nr:uncharacterized protein LACBIDRAFT_314645 [Laccaria bicolor S238N-H82]EDR00246.1 predicted protein [Laccaria bicolor S238N-H82]|eukprot:XP_001889155.1 predicted protein [Laccaria bicolor S238N-H82]